MIFIHHRINTIQELQDIPLMDGVEVDVRYHKNTLILHHDPFHHHEIFTDTLETFLQNWNSKGPIVLNLKTEGIEKHCIELMAKYRVKNWFFLDMSMPFIIKYSLDETISNFGKDNLAVRFSDYEPFEYALSFKGRASWLWVDYFDSHSLNIQNYEKIKKANFKICIVSPELQNHSLNLIPEFKTLTKNMTIDAVCTKRSDLWKK